MNSSILQLERIPYIYYLRFKKDQAKSQVLINSGSMINVITPAYIKQLGL